MFLTNSGVHRTTHVPENSYSRIVAGKYDFHTNGTRRRRVCYASSPSDG